MCGIGGVFSLRDAHTPANAILEAISHRGPDDSGLADLRDDDGNGRGALVHRRLSIIDTSSAGHQPMFSPDGRYCIVYNGEIYNYAELRTELERKGVVFRSHSDSEVLLIGWRDHGPAFLERLRGMFAFALWDRETSRGYLARDAFGIKPLYLTQQDGDILFASEVRSLLATGRVPRALSHAAVASYLRTGSVSEPLTIIDGIVAAPPGCIVEVCVENDRYTARPARRFIAALGAPRNGNGHLSPVANVREALRESVRYHLVADVPVAVFLSGGIDSTAVAGLASQLSDKPLESFTVTFDEAAFSEAEPAREAAKKFGTNHHEVPLTSEDLLNALPDFFAAMDQPSIDGLNTFVVSRAVQSHGFKAVLSGLGGDELFGGYPSFRRARYIAPLWKLPPHVRGAGELATRSMAGARAQRVRSMLQGETPAAGSYRASRTLFSENQLAALTGSTRGVVESSQIVPDGIDMSSLTLMQQVSVYELTGYMRNTLLRDSDVFSMAHGLELRVPFVDVKVARAAFAAAGSPNADRRLPKQILIDAVKDLLPPGHLDRPKRGFTLPFERWMRSEMFGEVDSVITGTGFQETGLDVGSAEEIWQQFQSGRAGVNWSRPWALYTLARWASQNGVHDIAGIAH